MATKTLFDAKQPAGKEPHKLGKVSIPERLSAACVLRAVVGDYREGTASGDEVYRVLRGSLYVLTHAECVEVAEWLAAFIENLRREMET